MKERSAFALEAGKALIATLIATATASWAAARVIADLDRRVAVVETKQTTNDTAVASAIGELRTDVRELRGEVRDAIGLGGK